MILQHRQYVVWVCFMSIFCNGILKSDAGNYGDAEILSDKIIDNEDSGLCSAGNSKFPVYLPHSSDCSKFYICDNGSPHQKQCHPGLHFNPKINTCDYPENVKCNSGDLEKPKGKIMEEDSGLCPAKNSKFPVYLPHPTDCSKFYICDSGSPHLKECHPGLHFNPKNTACDFPENANCNTGDVEKPRGKIIDDEDSGLCPAKNSEFPVYLPHPSDCSKFYICDSGSPHLKDCQRGLHFNPKIKACDFPENAKCNSGDGKNSNEIITDGEDSGLCPAKNSKFPVHLPHPLDCSKFYICDSGTSHLKECHTGLHFNPKINACDYPENAKCNTGDLVKPKGKILEEDSGLCPAKSSKFPVYLPHPSDCSKFFVCDSGSPHLKYCQPGLHFNSRIKTCDYPENAKCNTDTMRRSPGVPSPYCPSRTGKIPIFFRHQTNCSVYYMCGNGFAYEFVCPSRLHFNLRKRICDYEIEAGCVAL